MGIFLQSLERRSSPENPTTSLANPASWLYDALGLTPTTAGVVVNETTAMNLSGVHACVRVLSHAVASLPWKVYKQDGEDTVEATSRREYTLLHDRPNPRMSSFTFRRLGMMNLLLWGNFYAEKQYDNAGRVIALWPIAPWTVHVRVGATQDQVFYIVTDRNGKTSEVTPDDMIHVMGMSLDGFVGVTPIAWYRQSLGLSIAAENMGASLFGNGARLSGLLTTKATLTKDQQKGLLDSWKQAYTGAGNAQKVAVLSGDLAFTPLSINPDDAQFLETRKFQIAEVCRWFGVPPHKIADLERATNNNIEHQGIEFVTDSLRPHLVNFEQEFNHKLFEGTEYFCEFNIDGMLRGDFKSRQEGLAVQRQNGVINADEWRKLENLNKIKSSGVGDKYMVQGAMVPVEKAGINIVAPSAGGPPAPKDGQAPIETKSPSAGMRRLLIETINEIKRWENFSEKRAATKLQTALRCMADDLAVDGSEEKLSTYAEELAHRTLEITDPAAEVDLAAAKIRGGSNV